MKLTFLIPPVLDGEKPAERTAGCTRVVVAAPNIYELTVVALLEKEGYKDIFYKDFVYNGGTVAEFTEFLREDDSDVYYIWTVNLSINNDLMALELIRKYHPTSFVLFIGPGPTFFVDKCLKSSYEIVVRGEPEMIVCDWTNALRDGKDWESIAGISFLKEGVRVDNVSYPLMRDLDALPFPARHFIKDKVYRNPKLKLTPYTTMVTSRNCPFKCIYCVPSSLTFAREIEYKKEHNKKPFISFRSIENVDAELRELYEQGYKAIGFMDDNFIWTEERTLAFCAAIRKYDFRWGCQARVDAITENIAKALGDSGCRYVDLGVESFDDAILTFIKKGITSEQIDKAIKLLKKYHVPVKLNILIGTSPLETKETLRNTLKKAKALHVDQIMFNIVSPFPGTEFYKMAKENNWIRTGDYIPTDVQRESILNYPHLSSKEMENILFQNNLRYFLSPYFIVSQIKRFSSFKEFLYALKVLKIKLFG